MQAIHPASPNAPVDYSPEIVEMLASASAPIRQAAHTARHHGMEFLLTVEVSVCAVLTIKDPTAPTWAKRYIGITMTRKSPTARPAHQVVQVQGHTVERLQLAQVPSRLRKYAGQDQ